MTLDLAIFEASKQPTSAIYDVVLKMLKGRELFLKLLSSNNDQTGAPGLESIQAGPLQCIRVFTNRKHPTLQPRYGGMTWESVMQMTQKMPHVSGIMIVNPDDDWVVFGMDVVRESATKVD